MIIPKNVVDTMFEKISEGIVLEDGLVRLEKPGHTKEAARYNVVHEGRISASYFAVACMLGRLERETGRQIIQAIGQLQIRDKLHPQYGGMRWYREETEIHDTNAAFFNLMPFAVVRLLMEHQIPEEFKQAIDEMMEHGIAWFQQEIQDPILYYPNKIVSDGALLLAMSEFLGRADARRVAVRFFERWVDYTDRRGWGWGENASVTYSHILWRGLQVAICTLQEEHPLRNDLRRLQSRLLSYLRKQGRGELVPSIRSYNFAGKPVNPNIMWVLAGVSTWEEEYADRLPELMELETLHLWAAGSETDTVLARKKEQTFSFFKEKIFDDVHAATWMSPSGKLGSLNRFPVMPGCYQWKTWGLGWQSFPVSYLVHDIHVGFLRWFVQADGARRTHPAESKHESYLSPALFGEPELPQVQSLSEQQHNLLLVVRGMDGVRNRAEAIYDEWVIPNAAQPAEERVIGDRQWWVIRYETCAVCVCALTGIGYGEDQRKPLQVELHREAERLLLRQVLYQGKEMEIRQDRLEAAWAVVYLHGPMTRGQIDERLAALSVEDEEVPDYEVPRNGHAKLRNISMQDGAEHRVYLKVDPY